jgi:hypothetical protein
LGARTVKEGFKGALKVHSDQFTAMRENRDLRRAPRATRHGPGEELLRRWRGGMRFVVFQLAVKRRLADAEHAGSDNFVSAGFL